MPPILTDFLDKFQFGTALDTIIVIGTFLLSQYGMYRKFEKKLKEAGSKETLKRIEDDNQKKAIEQYKKDIDKLQESLKHVEDGLKLLKNKYSNERDAFMNQVQELDQGAENLHDDSIDKINTVKNKIIRFENELRKLEDQLRSMSEATNTLTDSDISTHRAFIIGEHRRCVQIDKSIDLLSLQQVENIYKKYLAEDRTGGDEFINNLVREIRSLPTKPNDR